MWLHEANKLQSRVGRKAKGISRPTNISRQSLQRKQTGHTQLSLEFCRECKERVPRGVFSFEIKVLVKRSLAMQLLIIWIRYWLPLPLWLNLLTSLQPAGKAVEVAGPG